MSGEAVFERGAGRLVRRLKNHIAAMIRATHIIKRIMFTSLVSQDDAV